MPGGLCPGPRINYFDTAWGYHGGAGELAIGRALKRHPRDSFYLADKFPGYDLPNMPRVREIFRSSCASARWTTSTSI